MDATTKQRGFSLLRSKAATKAVLEFSGGNDEGGVDEITLHVTLADGTVSEQDFPCFWDADEEGDDKELARILEVPVDEEFGGFNGDETSGTLTWYAVGEGPHAAGTVVMSAGVSRRTHHEQVW